jgi:DNA-binding MarR family transcriptional regulator
MNLARLIELFHRQAHRQWAAAGIQRGVTYSEYEYLRAIKDQETNKTEQNDHGQHLQDVVDEMGIRKASASAMVVKLEARGLVKRIPCQFDARAQHILLSEDGKQLLEVGEGVYQEAAQRLLSGPLADEVAALEAVLANMHEAE